MFIARKDGEAIGSGCSDQAVSVTRRSNEVPVILPWEMDLCRRDSSLTKTTVACFNEERDILLSKSRHNLSEKVILIPHSLAIIILLPNDVRYTSPHRDIVAQSDPQYSPIKRNSDRPIPCKNRRGYHTVTSLVPSYGICTTPSDKYVDTQKGIFSRLKQATAYK
jgi:hypothetical protein